MDIYTANPGPMDDSVLYDQEKHVSSAVWEGQERGALRCHEHTSKLDQWALTPKQLQLVSSAGFGYLRLIPAISLDNPLISALVERWRRETNTFHLNVGEMTVTLEDVAYLLGLAIEGEPVIGVTYTTCDKVCQKYLGKAPDRAYTSGGMVKLSWLKESFAQCPEDASNEEIERHTRAYLLYLLGSTIFSTTTGNKVPVMYLQLFEDFEKAGRYAWGAAALAFLYRALGNASTKTQSTISDCLTLLQCWSYYHLNIGRPKLNQDPVLDRFPLVLRWKGKQTGPTTNRDVGFYRKALDALKPSDVDWNPYQRISHSVTPDAISRYIDLGRSKTMLICFDKAERHLPDRCLRQFGKPQAIPEGVKRWERKSRGVDGGVDLSGKMENELNEWMDRWSKIVEGHVLAYVDESEYLQWYLNITRKFIGRPIPISSEFHKMNATLREVALLADTISTHGMDDHQIQSVTRIRYIAHECLRDQIGCGMVVSESLPEEEPLRKGRGKERIRRKGMGRRKRKDDTDDNLDLSDSDQPKLCRVDDNVSLPMVHADYGADNGQLYHLVSSHSCPPGNEDSVAMEVDSQFYHVVKEDNDLLLSHPIEHVGGSELCHEMMGDDPHPSQAANEGDLLSSEEATGRELQQLRSATEEEAQPSPLAIEDKVWPAPALFDANSRLSQAAIKGKSKIEMSHADAETDSQPSQVINQNVSRRPQKGVENRSEQSREASEDQKFSDIVHELNTHVSGNVEAPLTSPGSNEDPE